MTFLFGGESQEFNMYIRACYIVLTFAVLLLPRNKRRRNYFVQTAHTETIVIFFIKASWKERPRVFSILVFVVHGVFFCFRMINLNSSLLQQVIERKREVLCILREKIITTQRCTISEHIQTEEKVSGLLGCTTKIVKVKCIKSVRNRIFVSFNVRVIWYAK